MRESMKIIDLGICEKCGKPFNPTVEPEFDLEYEEILLQFALCPECLEKEEEESL
jgi:hypothetical protein